MDLNYIREFVVLANTCNYMEAAEQLFISQSALSRHIKNLEEELGVSLFDRSTRSVTLNAFGMLFLPYARQMAALHHEYATALGNALNAEHGNIRIGSIPMMSHYGITDVMVRFRKENPRFTLDVIEGDSNQLTKMLRSNQCSLAFIREWDDLDNEFNKVRFTTDNLGAFLPKSHPLAREKVLHLDQLKGEPLILLGKDTFMYSLCMQSCKNAGFVPNVVFTGYRAENIVDLVCKGMGIALLTKKPTRPLMNDALVVLDIEPHIVTPISLAYSKTHPLDVGSKHFLELVRTFVK